MAAIPSVLWLRQTVVSMQKNLPKFQYTISAEVTDVNGETHSASQAFNAGYHALDLFLLVSPSKEPKELKDIFITTQNLNGYFKETKVRVKILLLEWPKQFYRNRYWKAPDQYTLNEQDFRIFFPLDEYRNENDHEHWGVKETVYNELVTTVSNNALTLPRGTWKENGWYRVEVSAEDGKGHELKQKTYTEVHANDLPGSDLNPLVLTWADSMTVAIHSGFNNVPVLMKEESGDRSYVKQIATKGHEAKYDLTTTEWKATINAIVVKDNRAYVAEVIKEANPKIEKSGTLDITWATHRDKLMPEPKKPGR
jgi:hypothetical protein